MANNDIFGSQSSTFGGAFSADDALMTFPSIRDAQTGEATAAEVPLLLQSASFQYNQAVTRLYELTSNNIYYVRGRAQGQGTLNQILGPAKLSQNFMTTYGSVCNAANHDLNFTMLAGCEDESGDNTEAWSQQHSFTCKYVVLTSIGLSMAAQAMVIQQNVGMTFSSLEYNDNAA